MSKFITQIQFKHLNGALKNIPGVSNKNDLAPRLEQVWQDTPQGRRPVMKLDENFVACITLFDEDVEVRLTDKEKELPESVQNELLADRAKEVTAIMRANAEIRQAVQSYESRGTIKVLDWNKQVEIGPKDKSAFNHISELSPIALADFEDRGITVPEHLKRKSMRAASAEPSGVVVKTGKVKAEPKDE